MTIQVRRGADLGRLGTRERETYGRTTYERLVEIVEKTAAEAGDAVVLGPGGRSHTSVVLRGVR